MDDAPIRMRMSYSAAFDTLKSSLLGVTNVKIAFNSSELTEKNIKRTFHFDD